MKFSLDFLRRFRRFSAPGALLVLLLQRTPVVRVIAVADEIVLASPMGAVLRSAAAAAASLGALHSLAGATEFVINRPNPITGTVGQSFQPVSFTYNGTPTSPASFLVTGMLPPGLQFIPAPNGSGIVNSGTPVIAGTPTQAGSYQIDVQGFDASNFTNDITQSLVFEIAGGTTASPPVFTTQPANQFVAAGGNANFSVAASGSPTLQWQRNGLAISGATSATLTVANVQPDKTGIYYSIGTNSAGTTTSRGGILGVSSIQKVIGTGSEIGADIGHPNGNTFDQILLQGAAASITADAGQVTRTSYIDLNNDIVQIEFAGAGTVSLVLTGSSGPAAPVNYNQSTVSYMKGHVGIVVVGANVTSNLSVFTVGRATAFDPTGAYNILLAPSATNVPANNGSSLFVGQTSTNYDGVADVAFVAIVSTDGKFGGLRSSNARYWAEAGVTGVYAPGVEFTGPVFVGDITAMAEATPYLQIGSATGDGRTWITGGDLDQGSAAGGNGRPVQVSGITQLAFKDGSTSHGTLISAKTNLGVLMQNGVNVTSQIVVNP